MCEGPGASPRFGGYLVLVFVWIVAGCGTSGPLPIPSSPEELRAAMRAEQAAEDAAVLGVGDFAYSKFTFPLSVADAEEMLARTGIFAFGMTFRQVHAFNVVLDQPDRGDRFRRVADRGGAAGRLYAYCAFVLLKDARAIAIALDSAAEPSVIFYDHDVAGRRTPVEALRTIQGRGVCEDLRADRDVVLKRFENFEPVGEVR